MPCGPRSKSCYRDQGGASNPHSLAEPAPPCPPGGRKLSVDGPPLGEALLAVLRAAHGLTAAVWVGFALVGAWDPTLLAATRGAGGWSARAVAQTSLWALVITGAVLMLDRLADPSGVSGPYMALLAVKLACVAAMGLLGLVPPPPEPPAGAAARPWLTRARRERTLLALGLAAFVLGSLLTSAYEAAVRGG